MKKSDYTKLKKAELLGIAKKKKIAVKTAMTKAQIIEALTAKKPAAKKAKKKTLAIQKPKAKGKPAAKKAKPKTTAKKKSTAKSKPAQSKKPVKTKSVVKPVKKSARTQVKEPVVTYKANGKKREWDITPSGVKKFFTADEQTVATESTISPEAEQKLPESYGDHKIVAIARDPYCIYLYWELMERRVRETADELGVDAASADWTLRAYDVTDREYSDDARGYTDTTVDRSADSHYLAIEHDDREYMVAIGFTNDSGAFGQVAVSNRVRAPRASVATTTGGEAPVQTAAPPTGPERQDGSLYEKRAVAQALSERAKGASEHDLPWHERNQSGAGRVSRR